jgi:GntR family transcriptional regulator/MocR family aminotransferase
MPTACAWTKASAARPQARFALVTPSQQSPTGVALSLARRLALLR